MGRPDGCVQVPRPCSQQGIVGRIQCCRHAMYRSLVQQSRIGHGAGCQMTLQIGHRQQSTDYMTIVPLWRSVAVVLTAQDVNTHGSEGIRYARDVRLESVRLESRCHNITSAAAFNASRVPGGNASL